MLICKADDNAKKLPAVCFKDIYLVRLCIVYSEFYRILNKTPYREFFQKKYILLPAYTAFEMLQAYKLLLHFSSAVRTGFIRFSHYRLLCFPF